MNNANTNNPKFQVWPVIGLTVASAIATYVSFWYGEHNDLLPVQEAAEAPLIDNLFNAMIVAATGIFLLVQGALIFSAIWYRRRKGDDTDGPPQHGNVLVEIIWTLIPAIMMLWLAVYSFDVYQATGKKEAMSHLGGHEAMAEDVMASEMGDQDPAFELAQRVGDSPDALPPYEINVAGMQYAWIFTYPDTGIEVGELHVPVGRKIKLNLSAVDVIHGFYLPEARVKQAAIPGQPTQLSFLPEKTGEYQVICSHLCGPYHGVMKTQMIAHEPEEFVAWQTETQAELAAGRLPTVASLVQTQNQAALRRAMEMGVTDEVIADIRAQASQWALPEALRQS